MAWDFADLQIYDSIVQMLRGPRGSKFKVLESTVNLDEVGAPVTEAGTTIPVVFGTVDIDSPILAWYGDLDKVGSEYLLGAQFVLCHGPVDVLLRVSWDDKFCWGGATPSEFDMASPDLFSDGSGITGTGCLKFGSYAAVPDPYLVTQLGPDIPASRGLACVVLRHCSLGNSPYLHRPKFRVRCTDQTTFQHLKASIPYGQREFVAPTSNWTADGAAFHYHDFEMDYPDEVTVSMQWIETGTEVSPGVEIWKTNNVDEANMIWRGEIPANGSLDVVLDRKHFVQGTNRLYIAKDQFYDQWTFGYAGITSQGHWDKNPAHIIWECLTNRYWGMGYSDSSLDYASFVVACDTLLAEGFGLSVKWSKQSSILEFIEEICRHIDAALFEDKSTGKLKLKLIRGDYDTSNLLVLDRTNTIDVRNFEITTENDLINTVTVNFHDLVDGAPDAVTVENPAMVNRQGQPVRLVKNYPGITRADLASRVAQRELFALSQPIAGCEVVTTQVAAHLERGSVFKLDWPEIFPLPLVMRVVEISLGNGVRNQVLIKAVKDVYSLPPTAYITTTRPE